MLTEEIVKQTFKQEMGKEITEENLKAFMHFATFFGCLDCDSYKEAQTKILMGMDLITKEMELASSDEEAGEIMRSRYHGFSNREGA